MLPDFVNQLLSKHLGSTLYCVFNEADKITLKIGILEHALSDKIIIKSNSDGSKLNLPFYKDEQLLLLSIYNKNFIDLIRGKKPFALEEKLKVKEIKALVLKNLKSVMEKEVIVVYKVDDRLASSKGLFSNMGMSGVSIKPAPFYNTEELIYYRNVLHVYNSACTDLLNVKIQ